MMKRNYKHEIIIAVLLVAFVIAFYNLYGLLLPFILGLLMAFAVDPLISGIQKVFKNRNLATTILLAVSAGIILLNIIFLTKYINRDFQRLSKSFTVIATENKEDLDKSGQKAMEYISSFYDFDNLEKDLKLRADSLKIHLQEMDASQIDTESIKDAFRDLTSLFQSGEKNGEEDKPGFGLIFMFLSTILYFVLSLYNFDYFVSIKNRYFSTKLKSKTNTVLDDFNQSFGRYFRLRTKIVLPLALIYLVAFIILDMPGVILITIFIALLSYIPYLQYIMLIPLALGCLVLSTESSLGFLFFFGITSGVFILASLIEELVLNPRIMEKNIGMNPVIMILGLSVWSYLLGLPGLLIGIPVTSLLIIYFKRYVLDSYRTVFMGEN